MGKDTFVPAYILNKIHSKDGVIHAISQESDPPKKSNKSQKMIDKEAFEISICLHCPEKKCDGSPVCFRRRRDEVKKNG